MTDEKISQEVKEAQDRINAALLKAYDAGLLCEAEVITNNQMQRQGDCPIIAVQLLRPVKFQAL